MKGFIQLISNKNLVMNWDLPNSRTQHLSLYPILPPLKSLPRLYMAPSGNVVSSGGPGDGHHEEEAFRSTQIIPVLKSFRL